MSPRKEGQTGFKVLKPDNIELADTPEQTQVVIEELVLRAFSMSEPVFSKPFNPVHNLDYKMTVAEAKYYRAWPQRVRDAKEEEMRLQHGMTKKNQSRKAVWNRHWNTNAEATHAAGIDKIAI